MRDDDVEYITLILIKIVILFTICNDDNDDGNGTQSHEKLRV